LVVFINTGTTNRETYFKTQVNEREYHIIPFKNTIGSIKEVFASDFKHPQKRYYQWNVAYNIIGNLLLFFPFGILMPLLFKRYNITLNIISTSFFISLLVETVQYVFQIGIFDIDDIIYNVSGAFAGFYFLRVIKLFVKKDFLSGSLKH
jgi:glycopeptide antibiotics resistance protein